MSDIPEDIKDAAWLAFREDENDNFDLINRIEISIMNERKRCAEIALNTDAEVKTMPEFREQHMRISKAIASAIMGEEK